MRLHKLHSTKNVFVEKRKMECQLSCWNTQGLENMFMSVDEIFVF